MTPQLSGEPMNDEERGRDELRLPGLALVLPINAFQLRKLLETKA